MICIGPCCIPTSALLPLLLLFLKPIVYLLRMTPLAKYLPQSNRGSASSKGCCADAGCKEGAVMKVTTIEQWDELKRSEPLLVVDFTAGWCGPCLKMAPIFESLAGRKEDVATFAKVDIDEVPDAFDGMSIPAFHVLRKGKKVDSVVGASEEKLREMVGKHCVAQDSNGDQASKKTK